jgi:uncharacterized damage-inducible protein DinB
MTVTELLLPEFDQEVASTRRLLERIPAQSLSWKPHVKSFTMGELSSHMVTLIKWTYEIMEQPDFDIDTVRPEEMRKVAATPAELLSWLDANAAAARVVLAKSDADYFAPWTLRKGDTVLFTMPRYRCVRNSVLNHMIHHRAQLTVYLRENDVLVPGMYGPTADEA